MGVWLVAFGCASEYNSFAYLVGGQPAEPLALALVSSLHVYVIIDITVHVSAKVSKFKILIFGLVDRTFKFIAHYWYFNNYCRN